MLTERRFISEPSPAGKVASVSGASSLTDEENIIPVNLNHTKDLAQICFFNSIIRHSSLPVKTVTGEEQYIRVYIPHESLRFIEFSISSSVT